jgi:tetratricopeptide (TPR) repeat protein
MHTTLFFLAVLASSQHQTGVELYQHQDYAGAIAALQEANKTEAPGSADYRESALLIGQSYFNINQAPKAIPWLELVGSVNEANYMLGYAYYLNHQRTESVAAFARLFEVKPDSAAAHLVAGQMLLKRNYEKDAAEELEAALVMDPRIPQAHFILGEIEIGANHLGQAIQDMKQELAINPNYSLAWYRLGDAYARGENWDAAVPCLQRSIWLNAFFSGPFIVLGKCYLKQKNYFNAEADLKRALELDPRNYSATYLLMQTLTAEQKKDEAAPLLEKLKTLPHDR